MKTSWGKPVHVIPFIRTLLVVLAVAVCTVAAEDLEAVLKKAGAGDAEAQNLLGRMYHTGTGVPRDSAKAAKWYRKAAEQGHASAQYNLGDMYRIGEGVPKDDTEGFKWYRKAAEQGHDGAQFELGYMYAKGSLPNYHINLGGAGMRWHDAYVMGDYLGYSPPTPFSKTGLTCPGRSHNDDVSYGPNVWTVFGVTHWEPLNPTNPLCRSQSLEFVEFGTFIMSENHSDLIYTPEYWPIGSGSGDPWNYWAPRHRDTGNFLFSDGSVSSRTINEWISNEGDLAPGDTPGSLWGSRQRP